VSKKWWKNIFIQVLDFCITNAQHLHEGFDNSPFKNNQKKFRLSLVESYFSAYRKQKVKNSRAARNYE
jgi:hypothetical protein